MNEDLHDIDKLFKDGLDGHLEEAPPSVWEEVSHDLDKKQAVHFRDKYYRLKRAAILFLLIGFISVIGVLYFTAGKRDGGKPAIDSTSSSITTYSPKKENPTTHLPADSATISKDEPIVTRGHRSDETITTNVDPQKDAAHLEKQNEKRQSTIQPYVIDKTTRNTTTPDQYNTKSKELNIDNSVIKESNISKQTFVRKGNDAIAKNEAGKGFQKNYVNMITNLKTGKDNSLTNNRSITQKTVQKQTSTTATYLQNNNQPLQDALLSWKIDALPHTAFPPINLKQSFAQRTNVVTASNNNKQGKPRSNAPHGFYLTAFFAPNISFDHLEDDDHLAGPGRDRNEIRKDEHSSSSVSGGLLLSYSISNKVALQTGVTFTSSSTGIAPKKLYARPDNNGHTGFELHCASGYSYITSKTNTQPTVGDSVSILGSTSKLSYVSVPFSASLTIQRGKFSLHPSIGVGANFLTGGKTETSLPNTESATASITGLRSIYMDGRIGVGAEYDLTKKIAISLKPTARLALTPINQQTPVKSYQNYLSIEAGIKIKL